MDVETMGLMVIVEGDDVDFEAVKNVLEESGAAIHSIDEVASGKKLVSSVKKRD